MTSEFNQQLIISLIPYFKKRWRFDYVTFDQYQQLRLIGEKGRAIGFTTTYRKSDYLKVSCYWPKLDNWHMTPRNWGVSKSTDEHFSIGFSTHRTPRSIAKDIERRLLTSYDEIYPHCEKAKTERLAKREAIRLRTDLMMQVGNMRDNHSGRDPDHSRLNGCGNLSAEIALAADGGVAMNFRCVPYDTAIRVAALINDAHPRNDST